MMRKKIGLFMIGLAAFGLAVSMTACEKSAQATEEENTEEDTPIDPEEDEEVGNILTEMGMTPEVINAGQEYTFTYIYDPDIDDGYYMLYAFTPEASGDFILRVYPVDPEGGIEYLAMVLDDSSNDLMDIDSLEMDKTATEMKNTVSLMGDQTYYLAFFAMPENEKDSACGEVSFEIKQVNQKVEAEEITEGQSHITTFTGDDKQTVKFFPQEDGYYMINASVDSSSDPTCTAAIYSVLKNGEEDVFSGQGLLKLEKDVEYDIVYGVVDPNTEEIRVSILCKKIDSQEMSQVGVTSVKGRGAIIFTAKTTGKYLVYSVSEHDVFVKAYDKNGDIIAENDDVDGVYSENKKDFAIVINAQQDDKYLIYIDNTDSSDDAEYEIHMETYDK